MQIQYKGEIIDVKVWKGEILSGTCAMDTETSVTPSYIVPDLALMQVYDGKVVYCVDADNIKSFFEANSDLELVFHNAQFDIRVLEKCGVNLHHLIEAEKLHDTSILYRLYMLAVTGEVPRKGYGLKDLSKRWLSYEMSKEEQTQFTPYVGKPVNSIPENMLRYAAIDVVATRELYHKLLIAIRPQDTMNTMLSENIQVKGDYALAKIHENGIGFDLEKKDILLSEMQATMEKLKMRMLCWGWERGRQGNKEVLLRILEQHGILDKLPLTDKGNVATGREHLEDFNHIPFVRDYLDYMEVEKASSFIRDVNSSRLHPRYNVLMNTGRTSCSGPNFQQLPRVGGIREMFVAEKGKTLLITDYSTLELCTLAQVLYNKYGESTLMDVLNEGKDVHKYYASVMHNCSEKDVTKEWRQQAKAANFGFPGGLGIETFKKFARSYGLDLTTFVAEKMKHTWFSAFPEVIGYMANEDGFVTTITGRKRGNTTYCAEKNTPFQGLAADGAKITLYNMVKAGFKVVGFCHDEIITEVDETQAEKLLALQEKIMIDGMKEVTPDVRIAVESEISKHYKK